MLMFLTDVQALGLKVAEGLNFTETFYWDMNDGTRAFTKRFNEKYKKSPPTMVQAGVYSSLIHYFKALEALGGNPHDGRAVVAKMKEMPTDDALFGKGSIRPDGRKIHPAYLFEVKKPSESKYPFDFYKLVATIPADGSLYSARQERLPAAEEELSGAACNDDDFVMAGLFPAIDVFGPGRRATETRLRQSCGACANAGVPIPGV